MIKNSATNIKSNRHIFRAEAESRKTKEKDAEIEKVEAEILKLKSDIYNLKDEYTRYSMYGKFLAAVSPEDWQNERVHNETS